ncbi:MAG: ATP-binding protein [Desulfosporosinus sp.]|jgi:DNA replication protein DnaC
MKSIKEILESNVLANITNNSNLETKQNFQADLASEQNNGQIVEVCTACQDRGIILKGDVAYPCNCMQRKKLENKFRNARISRELMKCRLDGFRFDYYVSEKENQSHFEAALRALNASRNFVEECKLNPHTLGLLFTGPVGSGKTFLAASIANELIEAQLQVLFLVVPDLLDELRATFKSEINEMDLLDTARTIPVLVLDDLGAHNYTDWTRNRIYSIINYRTNELLPTIITSNLSLDEMEDYIGVRTTSRIIQSSRIFRLTVNKDIRHQIYYEREGKK